MYGIHYQIEFQSPQKADTVNNNIFNVNILQQDYAGTVTKLRGAAVPFKLSYQSGDDSIITTIRGSECEINFYNIGPTPLTTFYSEDDEEWKIEFYLHQTSGFVINLLLWTGFIVQDDCEEEFQDVPYVVTLRGTDNLGLLKDVPLYTTDTTVIGKVTLFSIIQAALTATGIEIPFQILCNLYENTTTDRTVTNTATLFEQTLIHTGAYLNDDGTWQNYYSVLEKILAPLNATLLQTGGRWTIVRYPEYKYFTNNQITGTLYQADFTTPTLVTYSPNFLFSHGTANAFINADQTRRIVRPFKSVKETFNYVQPKQLIVGSDLQRLGAAIGSTIDGDLRYNDYELPAEWSHISGDTSFIRIVTDTITDTETERFVYSPGSTVNDRGVQFNPIEVTKGDVFNFTLSFRTPTDASNISFLVKFLLLTTTGDFYCITPFYAPFVAVAWALNTDYTYPIAVYEEDDSSQFQNYDLTRYFLVGQKLPLIPEDGILLITVKAGNQDFVDETMHWNDIKIEFTNYINKSTKVIGHSHLQEQADNIKNKYDEEIFIDDSPRNPIAGTLYTPALTEFGSGIGNVYFTKTRLWHRVALVESLRLGEICTLERKQIASRQRAVIEGSFIYNAAGLSLINVIQIASLPGLNFVFGVVEFDFYSGTFSGTLWELYTNSEVQPSYVYSFDYIFETN